MKRNQPGADLNEANSLKPTAFHARRAIHLIVAVPLMFAALRAGAEGFRNPPPGTFNLGRAGGRIAQIDDASAIQQNPANLVDLSGAEVQMTPSVVYISADYTSPAPGQNASSKDPWKFLPNAFASFPLYEGKLALGLGITTPYGLGSEWDQNSPAFAPFTGNWRYQTPYSTKLTTLNFNPSMAVKIGDKLSVGAGLDVMWSEVSLKQFYPWFVLTGNFADPDGQAKAEADGVGIGGNFGLTFRVTERQRLALTARTPIRVNYDGNFQVNNVPAMFGGGTMRSHFDTSIKFPMILAAGYGVRVNDKVRVEADVEWVQFSNFKKLPVNSTTAQSLGFPSSIPQNWKDTFTVGIGGDWDFAPNWILRAGYQYYQSPVPNSTFSPTIPDANQNVFTLGIGYKHGHHSVEAAYGLDFYDTRNIQNAANPAFNGKYQINVHLLSFAYRYSF